MLTMSNALRNVTVEFIGTRLHRDFNRNDLTDISAALLECIHREFGIHNRMCADRSDKWPIPHALPNPCIADVIMALHPVRRITWSDKNRPGREMPLVIYRDAGPDAGLYVRDDDFFYSLIRGLNYAAKEQDVKEIMNTMQHGAEVVNVTTDANLVAVNNGIFDYRNKTLLPFSPDYVFTAKCRVDYNPNASVNPVIHNDDDNTDWNVEDWMKELSDDDDVVELLWQVVGAVIRPHVHWDKMIWLYSDKGMNGKGTLCELMKRLCGSYASISMEAFAGEFLPSELLTCTAIITDENPTTEFMRNPATLKAIVTGDDFSLNCKHESSFTMRFTGLMVQCVNSLPRFGDTTPSFYRRVLPVPFDKTFVGCERKYIKHDYLRRKDVLEYVLYRVLNMDYSEFILPRSCEVLLQDYMEVNDPVFQFLSDMLDDFCWQLIPWDFIYSVYLGWLRKNMPGGRIVNKTTFITRAKRIISDNYPDFECRDTPYTVTSSNMAGDEPLISEYGLTAPWAGTYPHMDRPVKFSKSYRGIFNLKHVQSVPANNGSNGVISFPAAVVDGDYYDENPDIERGEQSSGF